MTGDEEFRQQIEEAGRALDAWKDKHASLQDCFPEEAACSICYLSGLSSGQTEQPKHAVIVLCPAPSAYIQMFEWRDGMLRPREGGKYAVDSTAFEGTVKGLVDQFVGKPASLVEQMHAMQEAHEAIDNLFARLVQAEPGFLPSESGQPWEADQKLLAAIEHGKGRTQYPCPQCGSESELAGWGDAGFVYGGQIHPVPRASDAEMVEWVDKARAERGEYLGTTPLFRCAAGHEWMFGVAEVGGNGHAAASE